MMKLGFFGQPHIDILFEVYCNFPDENILIPIIL